MSKMKKVLFIILVVSVSVFFITGARTYHWWNTADPINTCASCHQISPAVHSHKISSHRDFHCSECHGTALCDGITSIVDKNRMLFIHWTNDRIEPDEVRMKEDQVLTVMENCKRCHESEFAKWESGGHSATYKDIFLNEKHNSTEQLNYDCLRCHGMYYEGTTEDLVGPMNTEGPWELIDKKQADIPTIPCMACHQVHTAGNVSQKPDYSDPTKIFHDRESVRPNLSFYDRHEKNNVDVKLLPHLKLFQGDHPVHVSSDPKARNCAQCHAPNGWHEAGTSDDKTPTGVHEGISCMDCHDPHSNDPRDSCVKCHQAISNCKKDVRIMDTSYYNKNSHNDIHTVSCKS
ncbi:MAG: hypothetical protein HQL32_14795, partial [Planctomycetes bacterium]|nr:hypothetical protein [Planctomycetota bacterium]